MPKRGRKFISEFLIPSLNEGKFGKRLAWVDEKYSIFQIQWSHKGASVWSESDCEVFMEWDKRKGHYKPKDKEYYSKCKQRFRAVLYKLINDKEITQLESYNKSTKLYCFGNGENIVDYGVLNNALIDFEENVDHNLIGSNGTGGFELRSDCFFQIQEEGHPGFGDFQFSNLEVENRILLGHDVLLNNINDGRIFVNEGNVNLLENISLESL